MRMETVDYSPLNGEESPKPLDIAIVGAGIGGLAAAIGLRRAGHNVSVSAFIHVYQACRTYNI